MESLKIEYVKLWMEQSRLFWSRLQSVTALHTGVLAGWYIIKKDNNEWLWLAPFLLALGILLSAFILVIMCRDGQYMNAMRDKAGVDIFPHPNCRCPVGRVCGITMVLLLMAVEAVLMCF
jgi:uncharacterized membrane protein